MYHDRKWTTCDRCGKEIEHRKGMLQAKLDRSLWCSLRYYLLEDNYLLKDGCVVYEKGLINIDLCEDCADELAKLIKSWMKNKNN